MPDSLLIANRGEIACRIIRTARRLGCARSRCTQPRTATHCTRSWPTRRLRSGRPRRASATSMPGASCKRRARRAPRRSTRATASSPRTPPSHAPAAKPGGVRGSAGRGDRAHGLEERGTPVDGRGRRPGAAGLRRRGPVRRRARGRSAAARLPPARQADCGRRRQGMRIVRTRDELGEALAAARREALKAFGDPRLLLERFVEKGRHVEIQVFADTQGGACTCSSATARCSVATRR